MDNEWARVKHAVETKSLDEACVEIIYQLRTTVVHIRTAAELMDKEHTGETNKKEMLDMIQMNATKTTEIVDELLVDILLRRLRGEEVK